MALKANPDIKRYIAPLLARRPELVLSGRWLVISPVTHFIKCVYFDRTRGPGLVFPKAMIIPLFDQPPKRRIAFGYELRRAQKCWDLHERGGENELCDALERESLLKISGILTPHDFLLYAKNHYAWLARSWGGAMCSFIMGDREPAFAVLRHFDDKRREQERLPGLKRMNLWPIPKYPLTPQSVTYAEEGWRSAILEYIRDKPEEMLAIMHQWEAEQVRLMKLEKYWQPAPFPCEVAGRPSV